MAERLDDLIARLTRRRLLGASLAGGGLLAARGLALPRALQDAAGTDEDAPRTRHVVLVAFAGGVRTRETFGTPDNVPTLRAMADQGVLYTRARTANLGHYGTALSIFTGVSEARGIRENARGPDPTLFEYLRKDGGLESGDVWISTSGGAQQTNYSASTHRDYGPAFGATVLDGDGIFNREFKSLLDAFGRPREVGAEEERVLGDLREALGGGTDADAARIERYIRDELTRGTSDIRGAGASDQKALRVARNLVTIFKPKVTAVVLQNADIAHGNYNGYVEVIRRNDAALGELWSAVRADPELRDSTAFVVLPEFGRDADLNPRRGLDHGDGSDDLRYVTITCWGPEFRRGELVQSEVSATDVCPTLAGMFGVDAAHAEGRRLPRLFG